ncbi:hemagglutinin repeat-containing protein, partial [Chromobacterium subtsugae]|uniref:hemagglutinin repeat-containing protein n=1 Tax=Chromobacterium subtsugae TaxID=251747 RepID=UPI0006412CBE
GEGRDIMVVDHDHIEKQRGFSVTEVNTLKNTFDNLKDVIHTQRGFGLLKGLANEAAASTSSQQGVDIAYSRGEQGSHEHSRTVSSVGSAILAGGDIRLQASGKPADVAGSGDLTITGSRLQGGGKVDLFANGSVNLLAGLNQRQDDSSSYRYDTRVSMYNQQMGDVIRALEGGPSHNGTSLSPYNQLRAESVGSRQDQQLQASEIRGDQIRVVGLGGDVNVVGATLQGVHDVSVAASQGSVNVLGGTEHYQSSQDSHSLTFGNVGGGNHSATVGAQHTWDQLAANGSAQSGGFSRIESQQGNVALSAADAITVAGAALQAGQDLSLTGKSLQIAPGVDQDQHSETHRMNQRGITGAVSSPILAAADAVTSMAEVASNKNTDARTRALAAGTASLAAYNGYQSAKSVSDGQLISGSLTFGASKSESREEGKSLANAETSLTAGRDLILRASGGGKDSNIDIAGSRLQAGRNATLQADNQIQLVSAQDSSSLRGENDSSGWGAGIAVSFGKGGFSFGGTANANHSFGKENGSTIDQRDTTVSAGDTLTLKSGGDATLKGAEARGQTIVANVGGNLDIESLQDQHQYQSSSKSMAGSVTIGYGFSASANYSQQKMDNDYASVRQQSGLKAGDGGYQVAVKGNTNLAGAVIASSDRAVADDKNSLSTGTLTTSDVYNHARSSGSSVGLAVSGSMGGGGKDGDGKGGAASGSSSSSSSGAAAAAGNSAPASQSSGGNYSGAHVQQFGNGGSAGTSGVMASSQSAESVTRAGISGGKLAIADDAGQQALTGQSASQAAAAVNRGVSSDRDGANALQDKFDKQQLQTAFTVVQTFTDQISTFAANKAAEAKAAKDLADRAKTDPSLSDEQKAQLQAQADQAAKWAPGGRYSQILTAATAGISGNVGNSLSGMAQNAGIAYLQGLGAQQIKQMVDELEKGDKTVAGETVRAVLHGALACAGAEASSQSCAAGAIGGAAAVVLNNALDKAQDTNSDKMTAEEKQQRENLVSSLLAGASVAAGAADTAATTVNAAKTEMENNHLAPSQAKKFLSDLNQCRVAHCDEAAYKKLIDRYKKISAANSNAILACNDRACVDNKIAEIDAIDKEVLQGIRRFENERLPQVDLSGIVVGDPSEVISPRLNPMDKLATGLFLQDKDLAVAKILANDWATEVEGKGLEKWNKSTAWADAGAEAYFGHPPSIREKASFLILATTEGGAAIAQLAKSGVKVVVDGVKGAVGDSVGGKVPVEYDHTIGADYNPRRGTVTGGHSTLKGDVRVKEIVSEPDEFGVYEAKVEMKTPSGGWVQKKSNEGVNTMFPRNWSESKIKEEINSAWIRRVQHPDGSRDKWRGVSNSGVVIDGFLSPKVTAYPVYNGGK